MLHNIYTMKTSVIISMFTVIVTVSMTAQNIVPNAWDIGRPITDQGIYSPTVSNSANAVVSGTDPFGNASPLWRVEGGYDYAGFEITGIDLDPTKSYRFSVWFKTENAVNGSSSLRLWSHPGDMFVDGNGAPTSSFYLTNWSLPDDGKWYLFVGFLRATSDSSAYDSGGVYEPGTTPGQPILQLSGGEKPNMSSNLSTISFRSFLIGESNGAYQFMFDPTIEEVVQGDDDVSDLLANGSDGTPPPPPTGGTGSLWAANGQDINYTGGKVGIGTTAPGNYELAVNGEIRAKEIKVETANWPDYVFTESHTLPTLEEVQRHIDEKGHLINIPSARDVKLNGIELGEMNRLLLEKIEELTLYILDLENRFSELEEIKN